MNNGIRLNYTKQRLSTQPQRVQLKRKAPEQIAMDKREAWVLSQVQVKAALIVSARPLSSQRLAKPRPLMPHQAPRETVILFLIHL